MSGLFLTIEGGEGAGKSLFLKGLTQVLTTRGKAFVLTREPGGTPLADQIRSLFLDPPEGDSPTALTELFLVSAARSQHVSQKIKPALAQGLWVLCDRFYDSSRVYQGSLGGVETSVLETLLTTSVQGCHPDLSFVLDCPPEISMARVRQRAAANGLSMDKSNRYDGGNTAMHERLRAGYLDLARRFPDRVQVLDAATTPEQVLSEALLVLEKRGYL